VPGLWEARAHSSVQPALRCRDGLRQSLARHLPSVEYCRYVAVAECTWTFATRQGVEGAHPREPAPVTEHRPQDTRPSS